MCGRYWFQTTKISLPRWLGFYSLVSSIGFLSHLIADGILLIVHNIRPWLPPLGLHGSLYQNKVTKWQSAAECGFHEGTASAVVLLSDQPSCSFSEAPVFFIFFGVFMKRGKMVRNPRMSTNLWQLSAPSGPIMPWSRTFIELVRDIFFSLQQRGHNGGVTVTLCSNTVDRKKTHICNEGPWKGL